MARKNKLTSHDRLTLIRVKTERAKKHLTEINAEMAQVGNEEMKVLLEQVNPTTGHRFEEFQTLPRMPFNAIATAGDIVHNLRTSLDHLANHLVFANGKKPTLRTEFPIAKDSPTYERDKVRKVEGMATVSKEAIDRLKPYKGGNDPLWLLHDFDNIDKHRMLFTVDKNTLFVADWIDDFFGFKQFLVKASDPHFAGVFENEGKKNVNAQIKKPISKPKIAGGNALLPTLHELVVFVENLVLNFEPFLR
jgi:hypothetical protein